MNNRVIIIDMEDLKIGCFRCLVNPDRPCDYGKGKRDMKEFLTLGYGVTTKKAFCLRLLDIEKEYGKQLFIVDVRRFESKSRNGEWCNHPGDATKLAYKNTGIAKTLEDVAQDIVYVTEPDLANYQFFSNTKKGLEGYRQLLHTYIKMPASMGGIAFNRILKGIRDLQDKHIIFALLCSERKPYKTRKGRDGIVKVSNIPNCHRIILAQEFLDHLGSGWEVVNL